MSRIRLLLVILASTLALAALAIVLMDREGDGDAEGTSAELATYFATMSAIDDESDGMFEDEVFGVEQEDAQSYAAAFDSVLAMMESEYDKVDPPVAVEEQHEALIKAIQDYRTGIDHGLRPLNTEAPPSDFEALFEDVLSDEDFRVSAAFCNIQQVATEEGITADVGCTQT